MAIVHAVLYTASLGIVSHYVGQALPRRWFHPDRFPYRSFSWEQDGQIYRRLGVQHWKDLVPDMSKVMPDMIPKQVALRETSEEAMVLVQETCEFIKNFEGEIPGSSRIECGNYLDHSLPKAKKYAEDLAKTLAGWTEEKMVYEL